MSNIVEHLRDLGLRNAADEIEMLREQIAVKDSENERQYQLLLQQQNVMRLALDLLSGPNWLANVPEAITALREALGE